MSEAKQQLWSWHRAGSAHPASLTVSLHGLLHTGPGQASPARTIAFHSTVRKKKGCFIYLTSTKVEKARHQQEDWQPARNERCCLGLTCEHCSAHFPSWPRRYLALWSWLDNPKFQPGGILRQGLCYDLGLSGILEKKEVKCHLYMKVMCPLGLSFTNRSPLLQAQEGGRSPDIEGAGLPSEAWFLGLRRFSFSLSSHDWFSSVFWVCVLVFFSYRMDVPLCS